MRRAKRKLSEVIRYLDEILEMERYQKKPSHEGLVIDAGQEVQSIGLSVNVSLHSIGLAVGRDLDLLITHHPSSLFTDSYLYEDKYRLLRDAGVSLYVAHDPLDQATEFGTAHSLASAIGLKIEGKFVRDEESGKFSGVYGHANVNFTDFVKRLESALMVRPQIYLVTNRLGKIAVITGWGGRPEWVYEAKNLGCSTFFTGEALMFGKLVAMELGINMILGTHYATEMFGLRALGQKMEKKFRIRPQFIDEENLG